MSFTHNQPSMAKGIFHFVGAFGMATLLLTFLVLTRYLDRPNAPDQMIRTIDTIEPVALTAPPPPLEIPVEETPPPPPPKIDIPRLEVQLNSSAPAITATSEPKLELTMETTEFSVITVAVTPPVPRAAPRPAKVTTAKPTPAKKPAPVRSTYSAGELDSKPRLVNSPNVSYPSSMRRQGNPTGKVVLEVAINTNGRVSVRRVIGSNHSDFSAIAKSYASRARFTVPKKNGRPVTAVYKWPIILKP